MPTAMSRSRRNQGGDLSIQNTRLVLRWLSIFVVSSVVGISWFNGSPSMLTAKGGRGRDVSTASTGATRDAGNISLPPSDHDAGSKIDTPTSGLHVWLIPNSAKLQIGEQARLVAAVIDSAATVLNSTPFTWSSSNTSIAVVNDSGLVTAVAAGNATITAASQGMKDSAVVTVTAAQVGLTSFEVTPSSGILQLGNTQQLMATFTDANRNVLSARTVTWSSSNTAVATVSSGGLVTAVTAGIAAITALSDGKVGAAAITVTGQTAIASVAVAPMRVGMSLKQSLQLAATVQDATGNPLTGHPVTWASSNTAVATVSSNGTVSAIAVGTATITATCQGISGAATITAYR